MKRGQGTYNSKVLFLCLKHGVVMFLLMVVFAQPLASVFTSAIESKQEFYENLSEDYQDMEGEDSIDDEKIYNLFHIENTSFDNLLPAFSGAHKCILDLNQEINLPPPKNIC